MELACLLVLSLDVGILAEATEFKLRALIEMVSAQLNALRRSQKSRQNLIG